MSHPPPITDSPWFWTLLFSVFAMAALMAIGGKYGKRQSGIEQKFQARQRLMESADQPGDTLPVPAQQGRLSTAPSAAAKLVPLWPLYAVLCGVALVAAAMLVRRERWERANRMPDGLP